MSDAAATVEFDRIDDAAPVVDVPMRARRQWVKAGAIGLALLGATALAGVAGHHWWTVGRFMESTDDAYVKADSTAVAPKVSGYIAEVLVQDNAPVRAGQILARIDERDLRSALAQSQAELEAAEAAATNVAARLALQHSLIAQAAANVAASQANVAFAQADASRYRDLMKTGAASVQRAQQTEAGRAQSSAQLDRDQAALAAAQGNVAVLQSEAAQAKAELDRKRAALGQAELNLSYATITAPVDGIVGARTLRVGQYVTGGTLLMAVVPLHAAYVVANFKETQLARVRSGQPVEVAVDGIPGMRLRGHVDSVSPASGLEFALLPPDNATGNFTKIVQRVPVKIVLDDDRAEGLLRAGMSAEPVIDTRQIGRAVAGASSPAG